MINFIKRLIPIDLKMSLKILRNDLFNLKKNDDEIIKVEQPLVLISQLQRSGGTLLNSLFDGHDECHVYPGELMWGNPKKWNFPNDSMLSYTNKKIFMELIKNKFSRYQMFATKGYHKGKLASKKDSIEFKYNYHFHKKLFKLILDSFESLSIRNVLNTYLTSFFNSWLNYQGLYGSKKYVVAFTPRTIMIEKSVKDFFYAYPDGFIISIIREPGGWWSSAKKHGSGYKEMGVQLGSELWKKSAKEAYDAKKRNPERVILISFEKLLLNPEYLMNKIYQTIGISSVSDSQIVPTFNQNFVHSDSSYLSTKKKVDLNPIDRYKKTLPKEELEVIKNYQKFYEEISNDFL